MTAAVLEAVGNLWAQADPGSDLIRSAYPQLGAIALLLAFGWWAIKQADKRTLAAEKRAESAEADARAVRDARDGLIREMLPVMTLQTARSDQLLAGLNQVVGVVERVTNSVLERPK